MGEGGRGSPNKITFIRLKKESRILVALKNTSRQ